MKSIAVVDYGSGNIHSMTNALEKAMLSSSIKGKVTRATDPSHIKGCDYLVLPGVGAFGDCKSGIAPLEEAIFDHVMELQKPFLGVCVGMQLLADWGYEFGKTKGLGWIKGEVVALKATRLPHMGWNDVRFAPNHPLSKGLVNETEAKGKDKPNANPSKGLVNETEAKGQDNPAPSHSPSKGLAKGDPHFYFDHSYIFKNTDPSQTLATTSYEETFSAGVVNQNIAAVQFHPEKSQLTGRAFLTNFISWTP